MLRSYQLPEEQYLNDSTPVVYGTEVFSNNQGLNDANIRRKFINRVYLILWFQLLITGIFIGICNQVKEVSDFMSSYTGIQISSLCLLLILISSCFIYCNNNIIRKTPYNWIYLILFTICMTYIIGFVGIINQTNILLLSGLSTSFIFMFLTFYAWQTKVDYTIYGNILLILLCGMILFGIIFSFFSFPIINILYSVFGSILFSFYIIYDTQLIVGGSHKSIQFNEDDFVIASISLYLDIINLFLFILDLFNTRS